MLSDRIEAKWIDAFTRVFELCRVAPGEMAVILSETQSRALNVHLCELALARLGATVFHIVVPTPPQDAPVPVRSTGASCALSGQRAAIAGLKAASLVVDCTLEGLLHAPELPEIISGGARIMMISNEHPEALERLVPHPSMEARVKAAVKAVRRASEMRVVSRAGTDLTVNMREAATAGVWGYTDRPGTVAHWPGGIVVSFPKAGSVNGTLVLDAGDVNLTFKRYLESPVRLTIADDYVVDIAGSGTDAELMRRYFAAWGDRNAYAVSHVGWGLNEGARYEALAMYDQRDTNGTEIRAFAGNFLFSTGANEFAGRFTKGHFDLPTRNCTIRLDGVAVVEEGRLVEAAS
ncbi:2,5-dihydroxypyridine 5,6-dioxygenase [Tepidamorphus gemmatus]|jgi:2,5-dihydroxypyridine 5,6-dioxygenase|uniref:2,5-dihydroxypyridine 5,6-dioxygenase n=1 Tax=Tepidamorphus gemmatus TaxID=747076 RepID=A0A4R3ME44_9HYPH|nr:peptidase M29 [Tepidamorphus gemmatus]TCT11930.1 2,5-dihydroxypyridine 5,6-dioxygenase [Tepidamorphus gemmatus]